MRHVIIAAIGFIVGLSCSLADELEGAACQGEADCDNSQTCVKTLHQLESGVGTCSSDGSCVAGKQAGCTCVDRGCPGGGLLAIDHEEMTDENGAPECFCCPSQICGLDQEAVIVDVELGTAQCMCCDVCPDGYVLDEDGNVDEDCDCLMPATTDTGTASSSG